MKYRALVLGAGSSIAFGYPLGSELRRLILDLGGGPQRELRVQSGLESDPDLYSFLAEFARSEVDSIDRFLAQRLEYEQVGKRAIAAILLDAEYRSQREITHPDHWYKYFYNYFTHLTWDEIDFSGYKVVTFNYDRSLEHFLWQALKAFYRKQDSDVSEKLRPLEIVHVYGSLSRPRPDPQDDPGYLQFGQPVDQARVILAASCIKVIPETRDDEPTLIRAREILRSADAIAFLGFAFDALNMDRLHASDTCAKMRRQRNSTNFRNVYATCLGMTPGECNAVAEVLAVQRQYPPHLPEGFYDSDCITMLRSSLALGSPYTLQRG